MLPQASAGATSAAAARDEEIMTLTSTEIKSPANKAEKILNLSIASSPSPLADGQDEPNLQRLTPDQDHAGATDTARDYEITTTKPKSAEIKSLETETKEILNRVGSSGVGRRCAEYRPTLDELKSTTFSDYIRGEVLGVPLPGYEFLYIYEDKEGREEKRIAPLGQVVPPPPEPEKDTSRTSQNNGSKGGDPATTARATRSQTKTAEMLKKGARTKLVPPKAYVHRPKKYQMCWHKLRDGIAKVSLPTGFGTRIDTTARGRHWAKGTKLGDTMIPAPIKQAVSGIGGVYEYTLLERPPISVSDLRAEADKYRKKQLGAEFDDDTSDEFCDVLARKFWRRLGPTMEPATYGADMEGTLFKDDACGWNVDRLESCLSLLRADAKDGDEDKLFHVPGVTSAYLYFGMWASAFAAHTEDMNLLSINYLHAGSPKYWYAIAQEDSKRFESLAQNHYPSAASECPEFLRHKIYMLSPAILKKAGIKFTTCVQRPGDAIITFPGAYHFGFNTGFNIAESTNFAVPEWIPFGEAANVCMCHPHSVRIQMKRLKFLLESYDKDMCYRETMGLPKFSYSNWAKDEAKRAKECIRVRDDSQDLSSKGEPDLDLSSVSTPLNKSIAIEITKQLVTPKKNNKRKSFRRQERDEWRLAKRVRPGLFVPNTRVIVRFMSNPDCARNGSGAEFFIGTVVKLVDNHVKVHLNGLGKKEDAWFKQSSDHLFLDGGLTDPPSRQS